MFDDTNIDPEPYVRPMGWKEAWYHVSRPLFVIWFLLVVGTLTLFAVYYEPDMKSPMASPPHSPKGVSDE